MATINYNGMELEEITKPQIFDPPRKCVMWDDDSLSPCEQSVIAIFPESAKLKLKVMDLNLYRYQHCAILPDPPKPRRATNRELARWLAQGNGEVKIPSDEIHTYFNYTLNKSNSECDGEIFKVRKWEDTEWHEPDVFYMEIDHR